MEDVDCFGVGKQYWLKQTMLLHILVCFQHSSWYGEECLTIWDTTVWKTISKKVLSAWEICSTKLYTFRTQEPNVYSIWLQNMPKTDYEPYGFIMAPNNLHKTVYHLTYLVYLFKWISTDYIIISMLHIS